MSEQSFPIAPCVYTSLKLPVMSDPCQQKTKMCKLLFKLIIEIKYSTVSRQSSKSFKGSNLLSLWKSKAPQGTRYTAGTSPHYTFITNSLKSYVSAFYLVTQGIVEMCVKDHYIDLTLGRSLKNPLHSVISLLTWKASDQAFRPRVLSSIKKALHLWLQGWPTLIPMSSFFVV